MDLDLQIAHSVEEIGQEAWDRLNGEQPFASHRWYRFGEAVLASDTPIYIILSYQDEFVARGTFWLKRREPLPISSPIVRRLIEALLYQWPLLACRTPLTSLSGLILPQSPIHDAALKAIAEAAKHQAHQYQASFLLFDYLESQETELAGWPGDFVAATIPEPGTRLAITWPNFDSYLAHLSKSMRKDYRRHCNRAIDMHIETEYQPIVTALDRATLDQAMVLIRNVENHHGSPHNPWTQLVLENAHMVDAFWLTAKIKGQLVGCGLVLGDGGFQCLTLLGLDYTVKYVYFQLIYTAIRCAIESKTQVLRGGGGAYEIKRRLGFQVESNNHAIFTSRNPMLRKLGRWTSTQ